MSEPRCKAVAGLVVDAVELCQRDLCACFDLLCDGEDRFAAERLETELFAAHRALNELRLKARRLVEPAPCRLLRSPGKG